LRQTGKTLKSSVFLLSQTVRFVVTIFSVVESQAKFSGVPNVFIFQCQQAHKNYFFVHELRFTFLVRSNANLAGLQNNISGVKNPFLG
jgi:hypothetical protein